MSRARPRLLFGTQRPGVDAPSTRELPGVGDAVDRFVLLAVRAPTPHDTRYRVRDPQAAQRRLELRLARDTLPLAGDPAATLALAALAGERRRLPSPCHAERLALETLAGAVDAERTLPRLHAAGDRGGQGWLVVDALDGLVPLSSLATPLPTWKAVAIVARLWAICCRAHEVGVTHRDLHAGHVLLDTDFAALDDPSALRREHVLKLDGWCHAQIGPEIGHDRLVDFAPRHAPEQWATARGHALDDWSTDLHALGWLAATLLTGRAPDDWRASHERRADLVLEGIERELHRELADALIGLVALERSDRAEAGDELTDRLIDLCEALDLEPAACHLDDTLAPPVDEPEPDVGEGLPAAVVQAETWLAPWFDTAPDDPAHAETLEALRDAWWQARQWLGTRTVSAAALLRYGRVWLEQRRDPDAWWLEIRLARARSDVFEVLRLTDALDDEDDGGGAIAGPWGEVLAHRSWALHASGRRRDAVRTIDRALRTAPRDLFVLLEAIRGERIEPDARLPAALAVQAEWSESALEMLLEAGHHQDAIDLCTWLLDRGRREAGPALAASIEHLLVVHRRHPLRRRDSGASEALARALLLAALHASDDLGACAPLPDDHEARLWLELLDALLDATPATVPRAESAPGPLLCRRIAALLRSEHTSGTLTDWFPLLPSLATNRDSFWTGALRTGMGAEILGRSRGGATALRAARGALALRAPHQTRDPDADHHRDSLAFGVLADTLGAQLAPAVARRFSLGWSLQRLGLHQRVEGLFNQLLAPPLDGPGDGGDATEAQLREQTAAVFVTLLVLRSRTRLAERMLGRLGLAERWPVLALLVRPPDRRRAVSRHPLVDRPKGRLRRLLELRDGHGAAVASSCRRALVAQLQDHHWSPAEPVPDSIFVIAMMWWRATLGERQVWNAWPLARALGELEPSLLQAMLRDLELVLERDGADAQLDALLVAVAREQPDWRHLLAHLSDDGLVARRRRLVEQVCASESLPAHLPTTHDDDGRRVDAGRTWSAVADALLRAGRVEHAIEALERARREGDRLDLVAVRVFEAEGRPRAALRLLEHHQLRRRATDRGGAEALRVRLLRALGEHAQAVTAARALTRRHPDQASGWRALLSLLWEGFVQVDGSLLVEALRWQGHDRGVLEQVARLLVQRGHLEHAIDVLARFVEIGLAAPPHWQLLAETLLLCGEPSTAHAVSSLLLGEDADDVRTRALHARALRELGHHDEAVDAIVAVVDRTPDDPAHLTMLTEGLRAACARPHWPRRADRLLDAVRASSDAAADAILLEAALWRGQPTEAIAHGARTVARGASAFHRSLYVAALSQADRIDEATTELDALLGEPQVAIVVARVARLLALPDAETVARHPCQAALCIVALHQLDARRVQDALLALDRVAATLGGDPARVRAFWMRCADDLGPAARQARARAEEHAP